MLSFIDSKIMGFFIAVMKSCIIVDIVVTNTSIDQIAWMVEVGDGNDIIRAQQEQFEIEDSNLDDGETL